MAGVGNTMVARSIIVTNCTEVDPIIKRGKEEGGGCVA